MMNRFLFTLVLSFSTLAIISDDWPQWMGPQRDGVYREGGLLEKLDQSSASAADTRSNPRIAWRRELNPGYSGPAVANGRVYLMDRKQGAPLERKAGERGIPEQPGDERVLCLNATTGEIVWEHKYDAAYRIDFPSGPRTTPIVEAGRLYTLGAMGDLRCLSATSGDLVWSRSFMKDFALTQPPVWGWAAHPLIYGNKLISLVGGTNSAVVAFDKTNGKELWRALNTREIGYAPPVIATVAGKDQLIIWHPEAIVGLRPDTGEQIWSVAYPVEGKQQRPEVTIAMPRVDKDRLFVTSFYHGSLMLKFAGEKAELLWNKKSTSRSSFNAGLHTTMTTPVIHNDFIYGICGAGELRCLNATTGERVWETRNHIGGKETVFGTSFLVQLEQAGQGTDRFFIWTDLGDLILARLTPEKYEEISRLHLLDPVENARGRDVVWSHPAFAEKSFFARNQKVLIRVSLAAKS